MTAPRRSKPCAAYKDSAVEWLGEIPAHWAVKKVKRLCLVRRGALLGPSMIRSTSTTKVSTHGCGDRNERRHLRSNADVHLPAIRLPVTSASIRTMSLSMPRLPASISFSHSFPILPIQGE